MRACASAFYQAIDIETIKTKVMRAWRLRRPCMISPLLFSGADEFKRWPYDVAAAKQLMAEAGYPEGFELGHGLPDRPLCQRRGNLPGRDGHARRGSASR